MKQVPDTVARSVLTIDFDRFPSDLDAYGQRARFQDPPADQELTRVRSCASEKLASARSLDSPKEKNSLQEDEVYSDRWSMLCTSVNEHGDRSCLPICTCGRQQ